MEERFDKLKKMIKKTKIGIYCEDPIILSCLKQIILRSSSNIEIVENLSNSNLEFEKVFVIGIERESFKRKEEKNFIFIKNIEELFKSYEIKKIDYINYLNICISLSKLLDLFHNIPIEYTSNLMNLVEKLAKSLDLSNEKIEMLKVSVSLKNIKNYLIEYYSSKNPYSTKQISPTSTQNIIYEFFKEVPRDLIDILFPSEEKRGKSEILDIIDVCSFYLENKDIEALRKEANKNLNPFFVEKLISILEEKKINLAKSIMLLDQEPDYPLIKLRLENQGFKVFHFENTEEALKSIKDKKPDLILSNIILTGMDGFSFLDRIKSIEEFKALPFIFISQKSDSFTMKKGLALGASDFISKPLDLDILITKIHRFLNLEQKVSFANIYYKDNIIEKREEFLYENLKVGYIIQDRFQILKELGEGGMGKIFLSKDLELKEEVVLKFLKNTLIGNRKILEKFKDEVRITRKLSHPNIVKIFDFWEIGELKFITQENIEGRTLREILNKNGPPPIPIGLRYARGLLKGIGYAHSLNIIHRDIKPENIIITDLNEVKILDFGIAKIYEDTPTRRITSTSDDAFGTPEYMSPEQLTSRQVDERSDIYSLGIVFYEIFTGQTPFIGNSKLSIAMMHIQNQPKPPSNLNPKIPMELERMILKMIEKQKEKRYAKIEEIQREIERIII